MYSFSRNYIVGCFGRLRSDHYKAFRENILVEWALGQGRILGYGLNWRFPGTEKGDFETNRTKFLENVIQYLSKDIQNPNIAYLDLQLEESWVPRISDEFSDIRRSEYEFPINLKEPLPPLSTFPQVIGHRKVGVERMILRAELEPGFYQLQMRYLEEPLSKYYLAFYDGREIGNFLSCGRGQDGTDPFNVQTITFPFVCLNPGQHLVEIRMQPGGWGQLFVDAFQLGKVSSLATKHSLKREVPGSVALDLWGWYAPNTYQRSTEEGVGLDYYRSRVLDESAKYGANLVEFFHNFFFPHFRWPIPWDESDPERPAKYKFADSPYWTQETLKQLTEEAHKRDMMIQWYQFPAGFENNDEKLAGLKHIAQEYGNDLSLSPWGAIDGIGLEAFILDPSDIWKNIKSYSPGMYIYDLIINPREVYPNFSPSMMAAHNLEPEGYDDRIPVIPKVADDLFLFRGTNWPGPLATSRPQGRISVGYQIECRYQRPPEGPFADTWAFGGGAYPDWVVKQCNDFFRERYLNPLNCEASTIWWINEVDNVTDDPQRRYVYAVSMDPIRVAIAARLQTTGRGGYFETHTLQDPNAQDYSRFTFRPREELSADTLYIQNNFFRLCLVPPSGQGILLYDPQQTAHFDNNSLSFPVFHSFLKTDFLQMARYQVQDSRIVETGGHRAVVEQALNSTQGDLAGTEIRRFTVDNDAPWIRVNIDRKIDEIPKNLTTTLDCASYEQVTLNGNSLESGKKMGLQSGPNFLVLTDNENVYPNLAIFLLDQGNIRKLTWNSRQNIELISQGNTTEQINLVVALFDNLCSTDQYPILAKMFNESSKILDFSSNNEEAIHIPNPSAIPFVRVVQVKSSDHHPYLVREKGWWMTRGGQPSEEFSGIDYVKIYQTEDDNTKIQPYGFIDHTVKPGWGCQYIVALKDIESELPARARCLARVLSLTSYIFSPRVEFNRPIAHVSINGHPWYYFDGPFVFLPNRKGDYRIEVEFTGDEFTPSPRLACTYAVPLPETRFSDDQLTLQTALPEWINELPPDYPLTALVKHEGFSIDSIKGGNLINQQKDASIVEFLPGKMDIHFISN